MQQQPKTWIYIQTVTAEYRGYTTVFVCQIEFFKKYPMSTAHNVIFNEILGLNETYVIYMFHVMYTSM